MTEPTLLQAAVPRVEINPLAPIPGNLNRGDRGDILQQEPIRPRLAHDPDKLREHFPPLASWRSAPYPAKVLARTPGNYALETAGRRMEATNVAAKEQVRTAHNAKALRLESTAEQVNPGKERQNKHDVYPRRSARYSLARLVSSETPPLALWSRRNSLDHFLFELRSQTEQF